MENLILVGLVVYLVIALFITVTFNVEPAASVLWPLFPIIVPIVKSREKKEKKELEKIQEERYKNYNGGKHLPTFQEMVDKSKE